MNEREEYRLEGLESDNLLAFLALLGLLRALEAVDRERAEYGLFRPRVSWGQLPDRPVLHINCAVSRDEVVETAAKGLDVLAVHHDFGGRFDLDFGQNEAREMLKEAAESSEYKNRGAVDLLAALMSDAAVKDAKSAKDEPTIDPTPLCLLFGGGHQHFLDRLAKIPAQTAPPPRGRGKKAVSISAAECLAEALFHPWHREDPTFSFRWDPEEAVRYALMAGDPTDETYKVNTQHGANRLAAIGIAALTVVPETRAGRVRPSVLGGRSGREGFSFAWPIWRQPATLSAIQGMLGHPELRQNGLKHLGVDYVLEAKRISVARLMNFTRGVPVE
jgi:hypothetical protein